MSVSGKLLGVNECLRSMDALPERMQKLVQKGCVSAERKCVSKLKATINPRWRRLCRGSVKKYKSGMIVSTFGLIDKKDISGHQPKVGGDPVFDWYKAYWNNYGTLKGRDPSHEFRYPIKKKNSGNGVRYSHFFEAASSGLMKVFEEEFTKYMERNTDKL